MSAAMSLVPGRDRPTLLMIGQGEPLDAGLRLALDRHGLFVEESSSTDGAASVQMTAPDLVLLVGDAAKDGGRAMLERLSADASTSVVPVALLCDEAGLDKRVLAFRYGATAAVPRSASVDEIARRVAALARELPEKDQGNEELGEATFDELIQVVTRELRSGILTVGQRGGEPMRIVLGAGRPVAEAVQEFVQRLRPLVSRAEPLTYEFHKDGAGGAVGIFDGDVGRASDLTIFEGLRILISDNDPARSDVLAQELRGRGAMVLVTDTSGRGLDRASGFDPQIVLLDAHGIEGPGYEVVRQLRRDVRLRWAAILVASWDELWPDPKTTPELGRFAERVAPLVSHDRALVFRASKETEPFDVRLEATGPSRLLRALASVPGPLHMTVRNNKAIVEVDVAEGLVVGATGVRAQGDALEGTRALAAMLAMGSGRVHVERRSHPATANVMSPVEEALAMAQAEAPPIPASVLPGTAGAGERRPTSSSPGRRRPFPDASEIAKERAERWSDPEATKATIVPPEVGGMRGDDLTWGEPKVAPLGESLKPTRTLASVPRPSRRASGNVPAARAPSGERPRTSSEPEPLSVPSPRTDPQPEWVAPSASLPRMPSPASGLPRMSASELMAATTPARGLSSLPKPNKPTIPAPKGSLPPRSPKATMPLTPSEDEAVKPTAVMPTLEEVTRNLRDDEATGKIITGESAAPATGRREKRTLGGLLPSTDEKRPAAPVSNRADTVHGYLQSNPASKIEAPAVKNEAAAATKAEVPRPPSPSAERVHLAPEELPSGEVRLEMSSRPPPFESLETAEGNTLAIPRPPPVPGAAGGFALPERRSSSASARASEEPSAQRSAGVSDASSARAEMSIGPRRISEKIAASQATDPPRARRTGWQRRFGYVALGLAALTFAFALAFIAMRRTGHDPWRTLGLSAASERPEALRPVPVALPAEALSPPATPASAAPSDEEQALAAEPPSANTEQSPPELETAPQGEPVAPNTTEEGPPEVEEAAAEAEGSSTPAPDADSASQSPEARSEALVARARDMPSSAAEAAYREALTLDPQNHYAMVGLARLLLVRGDARGALPLAEGAARRRARRAPYRVLLGDVQRALGQEAEARASWQLALELDPEDRDAKRRLGR